MARYCCVTGTREGLRGWVRRLFRRSNYMYLAKKEGQDVFSIWRKPVASDREDIQEVLCEGGHWTTETGHATKYSFFSERAVDDYVRRLNNGIPQNYEIVLALVGSLFLTGSLVIDIVF